MITYVTWVDKIYFSSYDILQLKFMANTMTGKRFDKRRNHPTAYREKPSWTESGFKKQDFS